MTEDPTLSDYFAVLRRWQRLFVSVSGILLLLTLYVAFSWSNYRSTAVVQIDPAEIAASATTPTGTPSQDALESLADQRISAIEQKVLSTASLIEVITKFDLYAKARENKPIADVATDMVKKIKVELVSGSLANPAAASRVSADDLAAIAFKLSFDYGNPLIAQQVTDELVTRFLDEDLRERRTQAQETSTFLGGQLDTLEASMRDQEKKLADYQKAHGITRPESLAFNQQAEESLTLNLQNLESQITVNEGTIGTLRTQLIGIDPYARMMSDGQVLSTPSIQLKALQSQYAALTAQYGPEHPDVVRTRHQIEALQTQIGGGSANETAPLKAQILDARTNLAAAQKTYGDDHPDVVALRNKLQSLEDRLATRRTHSANDTDGIVADADNPAYLQFVAQLREAQEQHKALLAQRDKMEAQQQKYQSAITAAPEVEQELAALSRDYDNAQMRYRELKEKKLGADMELQMQENRKGQRLTLIDPPQLPLHTHPMRLLLMLGSLIFSVLGGLGAVVVARILNPTVLGAHHLESIVGVAPLVAIPHLFTQEEREHRHAVMRCLCAFYDTLIRRLRLVQAR